MRQISRTGRIFVFLATLTAASLSAEESIGGKSPSKVPVRVFQVSACLFEDSLSTLGTIHAGKEIKMGFEKSGTIEAMDFEEGQFVKAKTLLARLDPREEQLGLLHSQAKLRVEETALDRAKKKLENHRKLLESGSILQSRLEEVELEVKEAELRVEAAKIQIRYSESSLAKTRLVAPVDATVAVKNAEAGETVTANTLVATLVDLHAIDCEVEITEQEYYRVRVGGPCVLFTDALPGYFFKGSVRSVPPVLTGKSRSIRIRIKVEEPGNFLLPGMLVHVKILLYRKEDALAVPVESLRWIGGKPHVFLVDRKSQLAVLRPVKVGYQGQEMAEIVQGLKQGDQVIVGQSFTEDQMPVEVVETQLPTLAGSQTGS